MARYYIWSTEEGWHMLLADDDLVQYCFGPTSSTLENLVAKLQAVAPGQVIHHSPPDGLLQKTGIKRLMPPTSVLPPVPAADREQLMAAAHARLDAALARRDINAALHLLKQIRHLRSEFDVDRH